MSQRHYPPQTNKITLSSGADAVLAISAPSPGQQISLDTQTANTVFAGPTSGGAAVPTFRALVAADIPVGPSQDASLSVSLLLMGG